MRSTDLGHHRKRRLLVYPLIRPTISLDAYIHRGCYPSTTNIRLVDKFHTFQKTDAAENAASLT